MMDEDQLANMLNNPHVAQQMNEMMNNDQFLDMMIQSNPMLRNNPNAREMVRSPLFRQMMTNPEALRSAARLQRMMRGNNGQASFPMPGVTDNMPGAASNNNNNATHDSATQGQPNPFDPAIWGNIPGLGGLGGLAGNPGALNALLSNPFGMAPTGTGANQPATGTSPTPGSTGTQTANNPTTNDNATATAGQGQGGNAQGTSSPPPNPFANLFGGLGGLGGNQNAANNPLGLPPMSPEALQQMMQLLGMGGAAGSPAPPADNRPPEERYAEQLRQLNDMGFYDFDRNVAALRRSGGSVQGAIEHLLGS
jgi:ubiquilin